MSKTQVPAIPAVTQDNLQEVARAVKGLIDVREGLIGDPLDANVTFRDLVSAGFAQTNTSFTFANRGMYAPVFPGWARADGYDPTQDFTPPSTPTGFEATGMFAAVQLQWDKCIDRNFSYTEVWRSETNVIGAAILIGTSDTRFYNDNIGSAATYYYWIRFVSMANIKGPYNATEGTQGVASDDPAYVIGVLSDAYGSTSAAPFFQIDEETTINGVKIAPGTYIKSAFIADATITNAKIKDAAINNAKIADLDASKITTGYLDADRIDAGSITSTKIDSRNLSIKDADGNVVFASGTKLTSAYITPSDGWVNANISINSDGSLTNAGSGKVTPSGIGVQTYRIVTNGLSASGPLSAGVYKNGLNTNASSGRSWNLAKVKRSDGVFTQVGSYDVYGNSATAATMAADMNAIDSSYVVIVWTYDEPKQNRLEGGLPDAMYRCGASPGVFGKASFMYRSAYVLIGVAGCGTGNGFESYRGDVDSDSGAWVDVAFTMTSGSPVMSGVASDVKIDATNISTYISGAAIDTAYIKTGAITNALINNIIQSNDFETGSKGWCITKTGNAEFNNAVFRGTIDVTGGTGQAALIIKNNVIKVKDSAGTVRIQLGDLDA